MSKILHSTRKVKKFNSSLTGFFLVIIVFNALKVGFTHDLIIDIGIILFIIGVTLVVRNYLVGHQYTFYDYSEINYKKVIFDTLRENGFGDYIFDETLKTKNIRFKDHSMELEFELYKKFPTAEPSVMISFKRWRKRALRESIIEKLEFAMKNSEDPEPKRWVKPAKIGIIVVVSFILIISGNTCLLRSMEGNIYPIDGLPEHMTFTQLDRNITDVKKHKLIEIENAEQIAKFYEPYLSIETRYRNNIDFESSIMEYYYIVSLDEPWKSLYVGSSITHLRVDYELMKAESGWKRPMVWLHQLFSSERYATYSVLTVQNSEAMIREILSEGN